MTNNTDRAALLPVTAGRCTCSEVFGEDPNCTLHGVETAWALENMLPSEWQTQVIELRQMLNEASQSHSLPGDVGTVALQNCIGSILKVIEPLLRFHETGGHEGDGSDKQLAKIRAVLRTPIGKLPAALSSDKGEEM